MIPVKYENCADKDVPVKVYLNITNNFTELHFTGNISVGETQTIPGEIYAAIENTKCDLERKKCEKYDTYVLKNVCKILAEKNGIFTSAVSMVHPKVRCPLRGNYYFENAIFDTKIFAVLPIDGVSEHLF